MAESNVGNAIGQLSAHLRKARQMANEFQRESKLLEQKIHEQMRQAAIIDHQCKELFHLLQVEEEVSQSVDSIVDICALAREAAKSTQHACKVAGDATNLAEMTFDQFSRLEVAGDEMQSRC